MEIGQFEAKLNRSAVVVEVHNLSSSMFTIKININLNVGSLNIWNFVFTIRWNNKLTE